MSASREGPNPLRPYYIPPSIGDQAGHNATGATSLGSKHGVTSTTSFGSSARNILSDMDYSEYMSDPSPSASGMVKALMEEAMRKYASMFCVQPFEVGKTVLQVQDGSQQHRSGPNIKIVDDMRRRPGNYRQESFESYDVCHVAAEPSSCANHVLKMTPSDDSDADSPSYFTSSAPLAHTPTRSSRSRRGRSPPDGVPRVHTPQPPPAKSNASPHTLDLKSSSSVIAAVSSIWSVEGSWGIWKGTNSTYVHSVLLSTITSFVRSFFSAFLALPDPGFSFTATPMFSYTGGLDILSSPSPLGSLAVAVSAAGVAGIILAPLDIARTKLILTPSTHPPRSILATLRTLPSWTLPLSIAPTALLHSTLPTLISASTPLLLRSKLGIDPFVTPTMYAVATFIGQACEIGVKLPIETVLRRGQMDVARSTSKGRDMPTVVEIGPYKGLLGTMRSIVYEEGERGPPAELVKGTAGAPAMKVGKVGQDRKRRKGQGFEGLWRGWRVGAVGLVGVWGFTTLGGVGSKGGEF